MDVTGCLGCDLLAGRTALPGGLVSETDDWVVNHCVGPLNLGTLVVAPRRHVVAVSDLTEPEALTLGPLLRHTSRVLEQLCRPEQIYVCVWSHGEGFRRHLHFVVQPVSAGLVQEYGGARSEQLQALMLARGEEPNPIDVEEFCDLARRAFPSIP